MSKVPSNRQVIDTLSTLPENDPFGSVKKDDEKTRQFFKGLYNELKKSFGKASGSSSANLKAIQEIKKLELSHQDRFPQYIESARVFWESDVEVQRYFDHEEKTKAFLESAYQLKKGVDEVLVLRRFVELAVYHLYQRAFSNVSSVTTENVKNFLVESKVVMRDCKDDDDAQKRSEIIKKYSEMATRGRKMHEFCVEIAQVPGEGTVDNSIYGVLFIKAIPDIFTPRHLVGTDYDKSVEHIEGLWKGEEAVEAGKVAKKVLDYHSQKLQWCYEITADKGRKKRYRKDHTGARQRKKQRATAAEKPRSEGAPARDVSDQVLSDSAAAQILNQMTRNVNDDVHGLSADPTDHITDPIARQVESNSAPFQIQNAEDPSSARLSASSTGLDSALFVYQNDSSVVNDESIPTQQTRARSFRHDLSESCAHVMGNEPFQSAPASNDNVTDLISKRRHQANMRQGPRTVSLQPLQIASSQWMPAGAGCNPQLQSDKNEPSSQQAASLAIRNQQAALATPLDSFSLPQNSEGFRQPARYSQQSESTQNSANYAQIPVASNDGELLAISGNPATDMDSLDSSNIAALGVHPSTNMDFLDSNDGDLLATSGIHPTMNMDFLGPSDSEYIAALGVHPSTNMDFLNLNDDDLLATLGLYTG
ncbi:hypothetical protein TSTA_081860 [Talaromyces stipitatus ATCC 10500]|uniref:Uncharacterized protein n=1 Tax=Talaromyces stipitatus (strain ATCC 10500 / CBS 375.48 / QM 6759 / NRRL 1006) TaxID=441959 RepID=B8M021_TALSN|nr:uncharacterized protein TSTA_081860 [Talaromyces stipitatus ATCC 10500]EED20953.1 hypothetical protein TSTA_081860 [Talaromyces stipitatus ATCC 10500]